MTMKRKSKRTFGSKSIRMMGCRCMPNKLCYMCSEDTKFGTRYKCTWNEAVRIHNEEVRKHAVSSRRKTGKR